MRKLFLLAVLLLQGCESPSYVPVEELGPSGQYRSKSMGSMPTYSVVKGDTLFSIALRYDLDYRKLALANNIQPPYIIRPNDIIYLKEAGPIVRSQVSSAAIHPVKSPIVEQTVKKAGVDTRMGVKEKALPLTTVNGNAGKVAPVAATTKTPVPASAVTGWIWPVEGKVLRQFSPQDALSKGIDIGGAEGTPVRAAKPGEVVYAGSGLKGYGNLVIIRHDDDHISAYAHNRAILVKEGQLIRQGEPIAELGMTGTQSPRLHFEIRENGKPVDPLKLLPTKK